MKTKKEFIWHRMFSCAPIKEAQVTIPAGAPVVKDKGGNHFVSSSFFNYDAILKHDSIYYGCYVEFDNVEN